MKNPKFHRKARCEGCEKIRSIVETNSENYYSSFICVDCVLECLALLIENGAE